MDRRRLISGLVAVPAAAAISATDAPLSALAKQTPLTASMTRQELLDTILKMADSDCEVGEIFLISPEDYVRLGGDARLLDTAKVPIKAEPAIREGWSCVTPERHA
jgi:hypothetical protein